MTNEIAYGPRVAGKILNLLISGVLITVAIAIWKARVPLPGCIFMAFAAGFWSLHTLRLAFANVILTDEGITRVGFTRKYLAWDCIVKWSQHGKGNAVFFETIDGSIHGFNPWCVFGDRNDEVAAIFRRLWGDESANECVMPPLLKAILSSEVHNRRMKSADDRTPRKSSEEKLR